jgi:hypothetical protein
VIEIAQNRRIRRRLHRQLMMRSAPEFVLVLMATSTFNRSHEFRMANRRCRRNRTRWFTQPSDYEDDRYDRQCNYLNPSADRT